MYRSQPSTGTDGPFSPWLTMELELTPDSRTIFSDCSRDFTEGRSIQEAASDWQFASGLWSGMGDVSGWSILFPVQAQPSASAFPPDPEDDNKAESGEASQQSVGTILLIEDNAADIFVIRDILQTCQLDEDVRIASDGQEALLFLDKIGDGTAPCPRLVLLDLNLPGIGGIELLKQIRTGPRCARVPVIIITSSESEEDVRAVRELDADAYFRKPTDLESYLKLGPLIQGVLASFNKTN